MLCSVCGEERPDRGTCGSCGTKLCCSCRSPLPEGRKNRLCRDCNRRAVGEWTKANPDRKRDLDKKSYQAHSEKRKESVREWRASNPEYRKDFYAANRESENEAFRVWYSNNPNYKRYWYQSNLERAREVGRQKSSARRAKKKGCLVSSADIRAVVEAAGGLCALCRAYVPEGLRHIDHVVPIAKGGPHAEHNLQLLCYRCNTRKGSKMPDQVAAETWVKQSNSDQPFLLNPNWK